MFMEGPAVTRSVQAGDIPSMEIKAVNGNISDGRDRIEIHGKGSQEHKESASGAVKSSKSASGTTDTGQCGSSMKARKRTKTGCLTCRKRRIKCGEERPTCNNCVKSKRQCEGYTPRVIFKDPLGAYRPSGGITHGVGSHLHSHLNHDGEAARYGPLQSGTASQAPLPAIAPRPTSLDDPATTRTVPTTRSEVPFGAPAHVSSHGPAQLYPQADLPRQAQQHQMRRDSSSVTSPVVPEVKRSPPHHPEATKADAAAGIPGNEHGATNIHFPVMPPEWSRGSGLSNAASMAYPAQPFAGYPSTDFELEDKPPTHSSMSGPWPKPDLAEQHQQQWSAYFSPSGQDRYGQTSSVSGPPSFSPHATRSSNMSLNSWDPSLPTDFDPSREDPDDDYFDVDSEEDEADPDIPMTGTPPSDLGLMLALSANRNDKNFRSLTNFLNEPNILATYRPAYSASPLMDSQTARVFCHFVTATAPTLSLHNRHPVNPSVMFTGAPVPSYQRSLFTYTLPMMALSNQGLLHSQLALASLHIAKLQHTSPTPSLKHYHYALRRVAKAVGHPVKRREVATLAATLLLGFYEVTTAEHNKWNSHLAGARELILDIDFAGMTKRINAYKAQNLMKNKHNTFLDYGYDQAPYNQRKLSYDILRTDKELDENLISIILGWRTRYDEYGQVIDSSEPPSYFHVPLTAKGIETFEIQCDLFWWYAKQDMYQSLISGNRLLLPFERWSHCPPRAPVGRLDAVYGSTDHLILLFARMTDFAATDLKRKIKVHAKAESHKFVAQERSWTDEESLHRPSTRQSPSIPKQQGGPTMYGMMPNPGAVHLPSGFDQSRQDHLNAANDVAVEDTELDAATLAAEREWDDLCHALDVFEESLGPDYLPLSPDHMTPLSTPFGPALYYRTYSISCLWTLLYTARIFITRVHPGMPPAAMAAAGVAAPRTAHWSNTIGRICAGLQPLSTTAPLNPSHGAALMDSCMGLFHAGVQYRDAAQRGWTITKLRDVARLTGWQTSALIASGCERSWIAAAEAGKGPPYTRTMNAAAKDDRVSGRSRKPNQGPPKDNNDRRFITVNPGTRVYWALGILGAEEDMQQLKLND